jgi:hypothetical protein
VAGAVSPAGLPAGAALAETHHKLHES